MTRRAIIPIGSVSAEQLARYLPGNYVLEGSTDTHWIVAGEDSHGWTLDDYVLPRLASGLIFGREIERVPVTLPHSEVCMYMRVAGRAAEIELRPGSAAQVWLDGRPFSAPILRSEAGVRTP